jgi:exopolysaccharide production protein ExoZ
VRTRILYISTISKTSARPARIRAMIESSSQILREHLPIVTVLADNPLVTQPPVPPLRPVMPKLMHLQILRAMAASLVVVDHGLAALKSFGYPGDRYLYPANLIGDSGVSAFFALSGLIMVRQSAPLFGRRRAPLEFAYRRITRIVPLYWIATFCWLAGMVLTHLVPPRLIRQLLFSLFFVPNYLAHDPQQMNPLLGVGWTLNYEMFFYLMFAFALLLPRRLGLLALLVVPEILVTLGRIYGHAAAHTPAAILSFYSDPIILLFAHGVLIGFFELELKDLGTLRWPISPAYLLAIPVLPLVAFPTTLGTSNSSGILAISSTLVLLCCTLAAQIPPGRFDRAMILFGDASYSTYLFHLLPLIALYSARRAFLPGREDSVAYAFAITLLTVIAANLAGLGIHLVLERPLIRAFRRMLSGRHSA